MIYYPIIKSKPMRVFTNLLFKVTVSSMVLTAPAMINGHANTGGVLLDKEVEMPFASATVIRNFVDHLTIWPVRAYVDPKSIAAAFTYITRKPAAPVAAPLRFPERLPVTRNAAAIATAETPAAPTGEKVVHTAIAAPTGEKVVHTAIAAITGEKVVHTAIAASAKAFELRRVINESTVLYNRIGLEKEGLSELAFEYAWRGYHNLLKKGSIRRRSVLSIADFSQSSSEKRMYVIDLRHKKLLYRTFVAHGQNSGSEFADSFSNEPESFKSSLGFYVTKTTYFGRNGLSLRLNGVDNGYNDKALKRNIVLHGCSYVGDDYLQNFGASGTSLGCPALPAAVSARVIRAVADGSCFFIYHPTQEYLDHSTIINE
jgi:hypothetical protein